MIWNLCCGGDGGGSDGKKSVVAPQPLLCVVLVREKRTNKRMRVPYLRTTRFSIEMEIFPNSKIEKSSLSIQGIFRA